MTKSIQAVEGRAKWQEYIDWDDLEFFSARAIVDHRPLKALLIQEG